jgi:hypothetical protein
MFRHDPKALLYAPLRLLIHADVEANAVFSWTSKPGSQGDEPVAGHRN